MYTDLRTGSDRFIIIFHHIQALSFISIKTFGGVGQQQRKFEPHWFRGKMEGRNITFAIISKFPDMFLACKRNKPAKAGIIGSVFK
jgi:hypothetical protein